MDEFDLSNPPPEAIVAMLGANSAAIFANRAILCCMLTNKRLTRANAERFASAFLHPQDPGREEHLALILSHVEQVIELVGRELVPQGSA